jgi:hypothetical protein
VSACFAGVCNSKKNRGPKTAKARICTPLLKQALPDRSIRHRLFDFIVRDMPTPFVEIDHIEVAERAGRS